VRPRSQSTTVSSATSKKPSATQPTPSHPPRSEHGYHKHDGRLHQLGCSLTETWDNPQHANGPKHETGSKHESEIERASLENLHDNLRPLGATRCRVHLGVHRAA
jgi:hypothetical protein